MKTKIYKAIINLAAAATLALAGCKESVDVAGSYSTPAQTISGNVNVASNAVSVSGAVNVKQ